MKHKFLPVETVSPRKKYILFKNDCGVSDMTKRGGVYEHYIFDYIRNNLSVEGKTIIDVGANFGFHTLEFADLVGDTGKVYSFEPQRLVYYQLCGNIIMNGYDNVIAKNVAIGYDYDKVLIENFDYYSNETINIGNAHVNAFTDKFNNSVDIVPLDHFCLENVAVIKVDVQGYEPFVLDGAIWTITRSKPIIFIEIEEPQLDVYKFKVSDVENRLDKLGYSLKKVIDVSHLVDYVAIPG